jgi:magnesium-transporting ATPase (P-type)
MMIFSERSIWTMIHGIGLGGGFLILFSSAFYCLWSLRSEAVPPALAQKQCRFVAGITVLMAAMLWLTIVMGTFVSFPGYRANPPDGADLSRYPKALIKSNPEIEWLHNIGMETKEHMPWVAAMLMTAVAYVAVRYRGHVAVEPHLRNAMLMFLTAVFGVVSLVALLGVFINKAAPLV